MSTRTLNILAIETATEACSAALSIGGEVRERYRYAPLEHSHLIVPMIDELMAEADVPFSRLDAVAFGKGPGSFTGVRIATATAQGIGLAAGVPLVAVSSLQALAAGSHHPRILCAFDARKEEVYWGGYVRSEGMEQEILTPLYADSVCRPEKTPMPEQGGAFHGLGSGWEKYRTVLSERFAGLVTSIDAQCYPHAAQVARIALVEWGSASLIDPVDAAPHYIRPSQAEEK